MHPSDKKQNVNLALALFHETTIAACRCYFPQRHDMANFLQLFGAWWIISNSNVKFDANPLGNAVTAGDGKIEFLEKLASYVDEWRQSPNFCLTKQTSHAFVTTLRSHAMLMRELLNEGYQYVMTRRLQSDPIENRFSQYRQMSGGRFLVSLREVLTSERILACRSLLKEGIDIWSHKEEEDAEEVQNFLISLEVHEDDIIDAYLSDETAEVSDLVSGYIARHILKKSKCEECKDIMIAKENDSLPKKYLREMSRGGFSSSI